jgi:hypothetical protein
MATDGLFTRESPYNAIVLVLVVVLVLERPLRAAEAEDEIEDEDDPFQQMAQHIASRGAASNGHAYVSLDKALAKNAASEIIVQL